MLWLVIGRESYQISACNIYFKDGKAQLWITKVDSKTKMIFEGSEKEAFEIKNAIDFAIKHREPTLELE